MTRQMNLTLSFLRRYIATNGISPTLREIATVTNNKSQSNVWHRLRRMEAHGLIRILPGQVRGIEIVHKTCPHCGVEL